MQKCSKLTYAVRQSVFLERVFVVDNVINVNQTRRISFSSCWINLEHTKNELPNT